MAELTEREIKIALINHTLLNPQFKDGVPFDVKVQMIQAQFLVYGIEWNEDEVKDLVNAVSKVYKDTISNSLGLLNKFAPQLKYLRSLKD